LTTLWRHADSADAFGDDMTVYPDHAAARVGAAATVAALIARRSTGRGCMIGIAQMETVFMQLAAEYLRESIQPGSLQPRDGMSEFDAPSGIFACLGEDAYCAVTVDGDDDWLRLAAVIGRSELAANADYATAAGRVAHRAEIDAALQAWTSALEPDEVARRLQAAGIAAGAAAHVRSLPKDAHLQARDQFAELPQPGLPQPVVTESGPAIFDRIPAPEPRPAPLMGEHSRVICRHQLGMTDAEIDALVAAGVVQEHVHAADDTVGAPR
jgi:crotonobetainyl-CoA:carnitine CoA-transferase CaiB-like acyl-CoA transferase